MDVARYTHAASLVAPVPNGASLKQLRAIVAQRETVNRDPQNVLAAPTPTPLNLVPDENVFRTNENDSGKRSDHEINMQWAQLKSVVLKPDDMVVNASDADKFVRDGWRVVLKERHVWHLRRVL